MAKSILSQVLKDSDPFEGMPKAMKELVDSIMEFGSDVNKACKFVKVEERKNKKLLDQNYDRIGKIISCHLVLEHFINRELELLHDIDYDKRKEARLTFFNKIEMLPKKGMIYSELIRGMKQINSARNMFAHNLSYEIPENRISEVDKWIRKVPGVENAELNTTQKIEKFTQLCIFFFSLRSEVSLKQFKMLAKKYPQFAIFNALIKEKSNGK